MNAFAIIPAPLYSAQVELALRDALAASVHIVSACGDGGCCGWETEYDTDYFFTLLRRAGYQITGSACSDYVLRKVIEDNYDDYVEDEGDDDGNTKSAYFHDKQWAKVMALLNEQGLYIVPVT